jgi:hypothetical protein
MLINNLSPCLECQESIGDGHLPILFINLLHTAESLFQLVS